jgi:CHAD domain-containing protein
LRVDKPIKIHWEGLKTVAENARDKLPELARGFFEAGRALAATDPPLQALHRFRLLTKRFRYTLELFRPCYGPGLAGRIEALKTLQQYLGEISDCATTRELLAGRDDLSKSQRDRLTRQLKVLAAARVARFRRLWRKDFAPPERERWWTDYLRRFAR